MRRTRCAIWASAILTLAGGCFSSPRLDSPSYVPPGGAVIEEANPMLVYLGPTPEMYRKVFECALSTLTDYGFEILEANAYDGRIETLPRIAPGLLRPLSSGNTSLYERSLATLQCHRHRATVLIQPADNGGYFIQVIVLKELEDLPSPIRTTTGGAIFRTDNNVDRKYQVVDPTVFESHWLPRGRDYEVEQQLLACMRRCL